MTIDLDQNYEHALINLNTLYAQFAGIPNYMRQKEGEELAIQEAKKIFGRFTPDEKDLMEQNTNGGRGVDITLDDGSTLHIKNQLELYWKVVEFNKEKGSFCDEEYIKANAPADFELLEQYQGMVERSKKDLINSYPSDQIKSGYAKAREIETRVRNIQQSNGQQSGPGKNGSNKNSPSNPSVNQSSASSPIAQGMKALLGQSTQPQQPSFADHRKNAQKVASKQMHTLGNNNLDLINKIDRWLGEEFTQSNEKKIVSASQLVNENLEIIKKHMTRSVDADPEGRNQFQKQYQETLDRIDELNDKASDYPSEKVKEALSNLLKNIKDFFNALFKKKEVIQAP